MNPEPPLIEVKDLHKRFCRDLKRSLFYGVCDVGREMIGLDTDTGKLRTKEFYAVNDVSFEVRRGECIGLVGRNGAGKTTLLKLINGLIKPDHGSITVRGRVAALIALGAGFNPILTGRENIYINGSVLGLTRKEINEKVDEIIEFSEIADFIDSPVQSYSSGMVVRLGFSIATALKPDVLLLDEVLAVGDVSFFSKCLKRIGDIMNDTAVIFVSHNASQIERICNRCVHLQKGAVIDVGPTDKILEQYHRGTKSQIEVQKPNLSPQIKAFKLSTPKTNYTWGEAIPFELQIDSLEDCEVGEAEINIRRSGIAIAHGNFLRLLPRLKKGTNTITLKTDGLGIAEADYTVSVFINNATKKQPLIQAYDCHHIEVRGGRRTGPPHQYRFELVGTGDANV